MDSIAELIVMIGDVGMSDKALLVMDMPESCDTCVFSSVAYDSELFDEGECYCIIKMKSDGIVERCKPDWCPLKPVPEKKEALEVPKIPSLIDFRRKGFQDGWNACIDEIAGGAEWVD